MVRGVSIQEQAVLAISFAKAASADSFNIIGERLNVDEVARLVCCVLIDFTLPEEVLNVEVDAVERKTFDVREVAVEIVLDDIREVVASVVEVALDNVEDVADSKEDTDVEVMVLVTVLDVDGPFVVVLLAIESAKVDPVDMLDKAATAAAGIRTSSRSAFRLTFVADDCTVDCAVDCTVGGGEVPTTTPAIDVDEY